MLTHMSGYDVASGQTPSALRVIACVTYVTLLFRRLPVFVSHAMIKQEQIANRMSDIAIATV